MGLKSDWSPIKADFTEPTSAADIQVVVTLSVTNTGEVAGSEIVQIYVTDPECTYRRPKQELGGFAKVYLASGETKTVTITLDKLAFSFYNDEKACWVAEKGTFILAACRSSRAKDRVSTTEITLKHTLTWTGV